jgi:thioredoxin reductase (NADPH)
MEQHVDIMIIGGGAAGLCAGQYAARAALKAIIIEELAPGGTALNIDRLENYPGFPEGIAGEDLMEAMRRQAENFGAGFLNASVTGLEWVASRSGPGLFRALLNGGDSTSADLVHAPAAIIATGAKHRVLGIPGEAEYQGRGVSYCATCDGPFFKGRRMLVVGGGDAACDEAMFLSHLSPVIDGKAQVLLIHRRDKFRAQKALANRVMQNPNIEVRLNTRPLAIQGDTLLRSVLLEKTDSGEQYEEAFAAVFVFAGSEPKLPFINKPGLLQVKTDENGYIITGAEMETNIPGLFAAGDIRARAFRQIITAAADGATAAHCAARYLDE